MTPVVPTRWVARRASSPSPCADGRRGPYRRRAPSGISTHLLSRCPTMGPDRPTPAAYTHHSPAKLHARNGAQLEQVVQLAQGSRRSTAQPATRALTPCPPARMRRCMRLCVQPDRPEDALPQRSIYPPSDKPSADASDGGRRDADRRAGRASVPAADRGGSGDGPLPLVAAERGALHAGQDPPHHRQEGARQAACADQGERAVPHLHRDGPSDLPGGALDLFRLDSLEPGLHGRQQDGARELCSAHAPPHGDLPPPARWARDGHRAGHLSQARSDLCDGRSPRSSPST